MQKGTRLHRKSEIRIKEKVLLQHLYDTMKINITAPTKKIKFYFDSYKLHQTKVDKSR